ncbi:MAG: DUF4926 domain-containing protein [Planctomycetes bacterium]|nr:DUF4926 domain-containing protein [Planctomycetota bacterium]
MRFVLFERAVLTQDLPEEGLKAGDVGVVVEHYLARQGVPEGYELELFSASGKTIAVVSVPASGLRQAREAEVLSVRALART